MENIKQDNQQLLDAAVRPILHSGRRFQLIALILGIIVIIGGIAYGNQFINGLGVTGLNNDVFWGIYITNLVALIGISYGGAVVSAVLRLTNSAWRAPITRLAEGMAVAALLVGALFPIIDLGHPTHIWRLLTSPNPSSPIIWDIVAITTYLFVTLLFFYLPLIPDLADCRDSISGKVGSFRRKIYAVLSLGWTGLPRQEQMLNWGTKIISIIIIPLAVSVHSVLSWVFAVTSRPGWHSTIFGPYFVVAALFSGVAAVILVVAGFRKAYHLEKFITEKQIRYLSYLMLVLGVMYLYFTFSEFLTDGYTMDSATVPLLESLLLANYAPLFWFFVIGAGIIPVLVIAIPRTRNVRGLVIASILVVIGMWIKRFLILVPVMRQALFPSATQSYSGSLTEAAVTLAAVAAIPLILMLVFRVFPVISMHEMKEVAAKESAPAREPALQVPVAKGGEEL
jgi:Ni/Fe-hydrogenase subunit HybB-like protein